MVKKIMTICGAALFMSVALFASPRSFYGKVSADGKGVAGVSVTDGLNVVQTDSKGRYSLESDGTADFVYITRPASYSVAERNHAPYFYRNVSGETAKRLKVDFELEYTGEDESRHAVVVWADTQVYEEHEIDYLKTAAGDLKAHLASRGIKSAAGLCCGDIIGQYPEDRDFFIPIAESARTSGIPFYYVLGNHDIDMSDWRNSATKKPMHELFGPTYYSFDMGQVHYVVLDNIFSMGGRYVGYIEERQMEWLENDLEYVPEGSTVVVSMHIPTYSREAREQKWGDEAYNKITNNRRALYNVLADYNVHFLTAHEHYAENFIISDKMIEHVHAPISGLFWQSFLSCDGVPWGYTVYEIDGQDVKWHYKAVGESAEKQFTAYGVGEDPNRPDAVVANVWNYDPQWKVLWYEEGILQGEMTRYSGWDRSICADVEARREKEFKWKYIGAGETEHLFYAVPSAPDKAVTIEVVDRFGNVYRENTKPGVKKEEKWVYTDAAEFPLLGKAVYDDSPRYQRLPQYLKDVAREPVWWLGRHSAGMCIRFSSDSPSIRVKWTSLFEHSMNHMPDSGTRGVDLYIMTEKGWHFAGTGRPTAKTTDALVISGMDPAEREYMLYLSLYDGIEDISIGVENGYRLEQPKLELPSREKPVVMYGTSILQGGCASRPGMAHTNIISRRLGREVINLGFSGNALMDLEIAELMASVKDPGLFVLDYVPNASVQHIKEKGETFFAILRDAHPDVPVIFIEDPHFPFLIFDKNIRKEVYSKNEAQKELYEKLRRKGVKNIYYISADGMIGDDGEATVDGIHLTDLGAMRYVEHVLPTIKKALKLR